MEFRESTAEQKQNLRDLCQHGPERQHADERCTGMTNAEYAAEGISVMEIPSAQPDARLRIALTAIAAPAHDVDQATHVSPAWQIMQLRTTIARMRRIAEEALR